MYLTLAISLLGIDTTKVSTQVNKTVCIKYSLQHLFIKAKY